MAAPDSSPASTLPPREPGQTVSPAYRQAGSLRYEAADRAVVGHDGPYFNNRPLYCRLNTDGAVLAGDRPLIRLIAKPFLHGALALAVQRGPEARWLHAFGSIAMRYRCGRLSWHCTDAAFPGLALTLDVVPLQAPAGFAARLEVSGAGPGDRIIWSYGGARAEEGDPRLNWDPVMRGNPDIVRGGDPRRPLLAHGVMPEFCAGNVAAAADGGTPGFTLAATAGAAHVAIGRASRSDTVRLGAARAWADPAALATSTADAAPMIVGTVSLAPGTDTWSLTVEVAAADAAPRRHAELDPTRAHAAGIAYLAATERAIASTPDPRLDAAVAAVNHAVDASCEREPYIFRHGCMAFSCRFVGWRVICGATALGWHERVLGNAIYTIGLQKASDPVRTGPSASVERLLVHEGRDSRFYGAGSLDRDFPMYDVQSQFFDQTIAGWRASGDPELERLLRPALELHVAWLRECCDPDDDGLYESYINTLPTDSVWYDGGGSAEASVYAFTAHRAARDLARRAGDDAAAARHEAQCAKIQRAMRTLLWLPERGHFGLYREQLPPHRVHADAWTYSVFLPIDAGLCSPEEALQALYYTEWALERIPLPFGGTLCQLSNWVPWKWSVRDIFGGDVCALALAYFQTGLGDEGYALLRGVTHESAFASAVPGGFSHIGAATDFGDNVHMYARTVVEGLFGYVPDYPNGNVLFRPAFPSAWTHAALTTPDFTLEYEQANGSERYRFRLTRAARVTLRLPVRAARIRGITIDSRTVAWRAEPGFGHVVIVVELPGNTGGEIVIATDGTQLDLAPISLAGRVGAVVHLPLPGSAAARWRDLHGVLSDPAAGNGTLTARLAAKPGHHLVLLEACAGDLTRWQVVKLHITDPAAEAIQAARTPRTAPPDAAWAGLDLAPVCNGDIRTLFQQRYVSPRPATCSVRLGVDGYSAWTFPYWNLPPPEIALDRVPALLDAQGRIATPAGVPFAAFAPGRNIAFTSRWDNWPIRVTVPVGRAARTVWLLVCGTTFPMQTRIANAVVRFRYLDGATEQLELIPPHNFWMLCPWGGEDYSYEHDAFSLPPEPPPQVQLGRNCRAMVLSWRLRPQAVLQELELECLSRDVVIGLMGVSLEL